MKSFEIKAFVRPLTGDLLFHPFHLVTRVKTAAVSKASKCQRVPKDATKFTSNVSLIIVCDYTKSITKKTDGCLE